jgi:SAM-dependent methyltransferase
MDHFYHNIGEDWFTYPDLYSSIPKKFGYGAKFVEIGCWKGRSLSYLAVETINADKNQRIYAVDHWNGSIEHLDPVSSSFNPELLIDQDWLYNLFLKNIEPVKDYVTPIRESSLNASRLFEDNSLDFVFIDAAHDYQSVKNDILNWYPKVKKGGIIAGHDYGTWNEVTQAVDDWSREYDKQLQSGECCWVHFK